MTTQLRALGSDDVADVARLHERAFPAFFLSSLGQPFLRQFYRGFLGDSSAVTVVAISAAGGIVGAVVGTTEPRGFFARLLRRQLVGLALASVRATVRTPRAVPRLVKATRYRGGAGKHVDGALLSSICVSPEGQGTGVGREILTAWEHRAAEMGARTAYLTTDAVDNGPVNAFYCRSGWVVRSSYVTEEGRMMNVYTKDLESARC